LQDPLNFLQKKTWNSKCRSLTAGPPTTKLLAINSVCQFPAGDYGPPCAGKLFNILLTCPVRINAWLFMRKSDRNMLGSAVPE